MNDDTVQADSTSTGGESQDAASKGAEPTMAELISKGIADAFANEMPRFKQSVRDIAKNEAGRSKPEEGVNTAVRQALKGVTLESGEPIDALLDRADRDARLSRYETEAQEAEKSKQAIEAGQQNLYMTLRNLGIDPNDSRINWALGETDYNKGQQMFAASVKAILGTPVKEEKKPDANADENFVDTSTSVGLPSGVPKTKAGVTKFYLEASSEDIAKLGPEIDRALADGRIKD